MISTNTLSIGKSNIELSLKWKSRRFSENENNIYLTDGNTSDNNSSNLNSSRSKNNQTLVKKIYKKFAQKINTKNFFTSKNKILQSKFNKTYINKLKKPLYQKASLELINKSFNIYLFINIKIQKKTNYVTQMTNF